MQYSAKEAWYAIRVKSRYESFVEKSLQNKEISPLYLTYQEESKRKDRKKILTKAFFPGYMFVKTTLNVEAHLEILKTIGVMDVLKNSQGPVPIPDQQIENVLKLKQYSGKVLNLPGFAKGMLVEIIKGPLKGLVGRINDVKRNFINVSIDSIPSFIAVNVSPALLEPLKSEYSFSSRLDLSIA